MEQKVILRAEKINKSFPGVKALSDVSFDLREGEVHILMGENGAGKSTLMKIFSGLYSVDSGKIYIDEKPVVIRNTKDSQDLGIAIIYQEFNLIPELTVAQNVYLNREPRRKNGNIDFQKMAEKTNAFLKFLRTNISPEDKVKNLGVAQQQLVEIAKALSQDARVLIMDEPTAALSENEIEMLFEVIRDLKKHGVAIIYISHRLQELEQIGDRVTILRDGQTISTHNIDEITLDEIVRRMVGRKVSRERVRLVNTRTGEVALEAKNIVRKGVLNDISLQVCQGEIVALAGLVGAGRTELAHAILGIDKIDSGEVSVYGKRIPRLTPHRCIQSGIGLLPESRKENGLTLILPIFQNITAAALEKISSGGVLGLRKEKKIAEDYIQKLSVACPGAYQLPLYLSGGNQQKVVLGKWLFTESKVLIFDEPTRGIDIGARDEIYRMIDDLAKSGVSILIISSDLPEIMTIADRVCVMREGRIVADLDIADASQEIIASYAAGGKHE